MAGSTFAPFSRLMEFPECPPEELKILAHALLSARYDDAEVYASLRMAKRITGLDAGRWLKGGAFAEYVDRDGEIYRDDLGLLQLFARAYLGETP